MGDWQPPARLASVPVPTLAMHGEKSDPRLKKAVQAVAGAVPVVRYEALKGQSHDVKPEVLAPAVVEFLSN